MKQLKYTILTFVLLCFSSTILHAQETISDPDRKWTVPAIYTMDEEVTWYFDFSSAAQIDENEKLFMWIWAPVNPTNAPIPLENDGNRIWKITMTPTQFFGMSVEDILNNPESNFYFLIRDEQANKLTGTLTLPKMDYVGDFKLKGVEMDYAPANFQITSTVSILFNANLSDGFLPVTSTVHLHSGLNDWAVTKGFDAWIPETRNKTKFTHLGDGIYKKDINLMDYYDVTDDFELENIVFLAVKYNGDDNGSPDWAGASRDFKILAPDAPIQPDPEFSFFPQKFSKYDILMLIRKNNEKGTLALEYSIKSGTIELKGEFFGNSLTDKRAYINLLEGLKTLNDVTQIQLVVKRNGLEIVNTNLPVVSVSELE